MTATNTPRFFFEYSNGQCWIFDCLAGRTALELPTMPALTSLANELLSDG